MPDPRLSTTPLRWALTALLALSLGLASCRRDGDTFVEYTGDDGDGLALNATLLPLMEDAGATSASAAPADSEAMVELGRALFFDKVLSGNGNVSCATCHHPTAGTGDNLPVSIGVGGGGIAGVRNRGALDDAPLIPRNAPHLFNVGLEGADTMFWDSRVRIDPSTGELTTPEPALNGAAPSAPAIAAQLNTALAAQAMFPVTSFDEMRGAPGSNDVADAANNLEVWQILTARLVGTNNGTVGGFAGYRTLFTAAYPSLTNYDDVNFGHAGRAIAAFERHAWTGVSTDYDRYLAGDRSALSDQEKRGALLFFGEARCAQCHSGPLLSDFEHHALCVPQVGPGKEAGGQIEDLGLSLQTGNPDDDYKFRTPPLRNVALAGPYMHDGAFATLENAVRHHLDPATSLFAYDAAQLPLTFRGTVDTDANRNADRAAAMSPILLSMPPLADEQVADLVAFLNALTDPAMLDLKADFPDTVPSGLSLGD